MLVRIEGKRGIVDIERPVAAKIIKETVLRHKEVFALTNAKGQISLVPKKISFDRNADYIVIRRDKEGKIRIQLYVILFFGLPISQVTRGLISEIRRDLRAYLQLEPEHIQIDVVGLKTKKTMVERRISIEDSLEGKKQSGEREKRTEEREGDKQPAGKSETENAHDGIPGRIPQYGYDRRKQKRTEYVFR